MAKTPATTPIIGVLAYDIDFDICKNFDKNYPFFISAAYQKWLESSGARVIPVWAGKSDDYYKEIMKKINGIMFTGGQFYFNDKKFGKAAYSAKTIYDIAIQMNQNGTYFPIWGTCLGAELLFYAASDGATDSRFEGQPVHANLPLTFCQGYEKSKLFKGMDANMLEIIKRDPVTYNSNKFFVNQKILKEFGMVDDWKILSTNINPDNKEYIVTFEHAKYPFYGVMFHPEKTQFESYPIQIPHTENSIKVSQYFASFFVSEAKLNSNSFEGDELRHLIINFPVYFTEKSVPKFRQCYLFKETTDYPPADK